ncbi:unnamed protein product [Cuscuta epithymum]|uniref:Uncharacterized protein n=1 Tax=Cuscuta epithymum TaxID=186058 RepID=A0AAV0CQC5_9ASTE|nr:unnamed protein product [Cuscuta epithymum]
MKLSVPKSDPLAIFFGSENSTIRCRNHPKLQVCSCSVSDQTRSQLNTPTVQNESLEVTNKLSKFQKDPTTGTPPINELNEVAQCRSKNEHAVKFSYVCPSISSAFPA